MLFTVRLFKYGIGVHAIYCQIIQIWNWWYMLFTVRLFKYGIGVHAIYCQIIQIWNWCACYLLSEYTNMELVCMLFNVRLYKYGIGVHAIFCKFNSDIVSYTNYLNEMCS
jgi:hypothetical protein